MRRIKYRMHSYYRKLKDTTAQAPLAIKEKLELNINLCLLLAVQAVAAFILSLILRAMIFSYLGLLYIVVIAFLLMAVPRYLKCCRKYLVITGSVKDIKKTSIKSTFSIRSYRRVILSPYSIGGSMESAKEKEPIEVQLPNTCFIRVQEGSCYAFYYDIVASGARYGVSNFIAYKKLPVKDETDKENDYDKIGVEADKYG